MAGSEREPPAGQVCAHLEQEPLWRLSVHSATAKEFARLGRRFSGRCGFPLSAARFRAACLPCLYQAAVLNGRRGLRCRVWRAAVFGRLVCRRTRCGLRCGKGALPFWLRSQEARQRAGRSGPVAARSDWTAVVSPGVLSRVSVLGRSVLSSCDGLVWPGSRSSTSRSSWQRRPPAIFPCLRLSPPSFLARAK